jgi:superfamily II DNA or RNA helicase
MKLTHIKTLDVAQSCHFNSVSSYQELEKAINTFALEKGIAGSDPYNERVGFAYEVYCEFFLRMFGTRANPLLGITNVVDTSRNKYQPGYDFIAENLHNQRILIQTKYRSDPTYQFTFADLGSLYGMADKENISNERVVIFTNLEHKPGNGSYGIYHTMMGYEPFRVLDRAAQEAHIVREPKFWDDFRSILKSSISRMSITAVPSMRLYQDDVFNETLKVMKSELSRARFIVATGGGKTLIEYKVLKYGFSNALKLQVIVAPTIALLTQHHVNFERWGMFDPLSENAVAIHFRTGSDPREDVHVDYEQTTKIEELMNILNKYDDRNKLVFLTYASADKFFNGLKSLNHNVDTVVWDEFHHAVKQNDNYKKQFKTLAAKRHLFFSASEKCGRKMSSTDEKLYGPRLSCVSYSYLRNEGVLVPKILIKLIKLDGRKLKKLKVDLEKVAEQEKFKLDVAMKEAAALLVARNDMLATTGSSNIVMMGKSVPICKAICASPTMRAAIGVETLLQTVHAAIPSDQRRDIFEKVKKSTDSLLPQHSVVKEGIDVTAFNAAIFSREMETIGTQQALGRIVRADPRDTLRLKTGELTIDSPYGWFKPIATAYVIIHDEDMENFESYMRELIKKLESCGLTEADYQFVDITESKHSASIDMTGWISKLETKDIIDAGSLQEYATKLSIEIAEDEEEEEVREQTSKTFKSYGFKQLLAANPDV